MAPRVFRAPEGPAAREARRPHYVRCRASKPARALRSLRRPPHQWGLVADVCLYVGSKPGQASPPPINVARNSPATCSNIEFASLELQCFWGVSKNDRVKLRAKFGRWWCRCCPWVSQPGPREMRPQQPAPQRKALIKGKWPPVKAVTSLDNGRKWRVRAGRTLELLR